MAQTGRAFLVEWVRMTTDARALIDGFLGQAQEYGVICLEPDGTVCGWLGAAQQMFGYTPQELVGRPAACLFTEHDRRKGLDRHELEVARQDSRSEDDRWHVRKDGTKIWVSGSVTCVRDAQAGVLGFVKVVRDRTDLRAHVERLENKVADLQAREQRGRTFLRTLGHELRNPLTPLQNAALIIQKLSTDERVLRAVQVQISQISALTKMADDLMDASRLESGQLDVHLERQDLRDILRDTCIGFDGMARDKQIALQALLPEGTLDVLVDRPRFQQVVTNLLSNALKYTPERGQVWIKATEEGDDVVLRIEDTGMGIGPEMLPKLFELFSRADDAAAVAPSGMGIGLAVVREIVELHGGTVQARSAGVGQGSEFTVRLPAAPAAAAAAGPSNPEDTG